MEVLELLSSLELFLFGACDGVVQLGFISAIINAASNAGTQIAQGIQAKKDRDQAQAQFEASQAENKRQYDQSMAFNQSNEDARRKQEAWSNSWSSRSAALANKAASQDLILGSQSIRQGALDTKLKEIQGRGEIENLKNVAVGKAQALQSLNKRKAE